MLSGIRHRFRYLFLVAFLLQFPLKFELSPRRRAFFCCALSPHRFLFPCRFLRYFALRLRYAPHALCLGARLHARSKGLGHYQPILIFRCAASYRSASSSVILRCTSVMLRFPLICCAPRPTLQRSWPSPADPDSRF